MDYFRPNMSIAEINGISMLGLAHIGDAVYELMTRAEICEKGISSVQEMHKQTTSRVKAQAQAKAADIILSILDEDEITIYRRGRNTHVNSIPHSANVSQYHSATGIEALFGWLYLQGKTERLNDLFSIISASLDKKEK